MKSLINYAINHNITTFIEISTCRVGNNNDQQFCLLKLMAFFFLKVIEILMSIKKNMSRIPTSQASETSGLIE